MITKELIERFFGNGCTDEEKQLVLGFFREHPEELEKYLNEDEWENFQFSEQMDPKLKVKLFKEVKSKTTGKGRGVKTIIRLAVAACLILLLGLGWIFLGNKDERDLSKTPSAVSPEGIALKEIANTTMKSMTISLEDGSVVQLEPNSRIQFAEPFVSNNRRDINLYGQASFKVAKDKTKPFTVYADGISTTALGTFFIVKSFDTSSTVTVQLKEGKVVVRSADSIMKKFKEEFFLLPGDEMIYTKITKLAILRHPVSPRQMVAAGGNQNESTIVNRPDWYTFNSAPLSEVFNQLSSYYGVEIYYYPDEVSNRFYSGRIEKTDSLENILKDIALLNHYILDKKNGAYFIQRKIR